MECKICLHNFLKLRLLLKKKSKFLWPSQNIRTFIKAVVYDKKDGSNSGPKVNQCITLAIFWVYFLFSLKVIKLTDSVEYSEHIKCTNAPRFCAIRADTCYKSYWPTVLQHNGPKYFLKEHSFFPYLRPTYFHKTIHPRS